MAQIRQIVEHLQTMHEIGTKGAHILRCKSLYTAIVSLCPVGKGRQLQVTQQCQYNTGQMSGTVGIVLAGADGHVDNVYPG